MMWIWVISALLVTAAGLRYRRRLHAAGRAPRVDDAAIRQILEQGRLPGEAAPGRMDMSAAARAEDEFWSESWDEPEEYRP